MRYTKEKQSKRAKMSQMSGEEDMVNMDDSQKAYGASDYKNLSFAF